MFEQLHYRYDAAGNLQYRTNNALTQNFQVNALNELTAETNGGRLTVMGATTPIATSVTVNGSNAVLYGDYSFVATNMPLTNNYTALALGNGLAATNAVAFNLASNAVFQYDGNGNLTNDGWRNFIYDDENQLIQVSVSNQWKSQFVYDGKMRRRIRTEFAWQSNNWVQTNQVFYVYDGNLVIQERATNNLPLVAYTRGQDLSGSLQGAGGIGGLLARTDTNGPTFYHADGNGNITMLINGSQAVVAKFMLDVYRAHFHKHAAVLIVSSLLRRVAQVMFLTLEWINPLSLEFLIFFLLLLVNGIHYLWYYQVMRPRRLFYYSEFRGLARHVFVGLSLVILLAGVLNIFIRKSELLLTVPAFLNCYYIIIISLFYRQRSVKVKEK